MRSFTISNEKGQDWLLAEKNRDTTTKISKEAPCENSQKIDYKKKVPRPLKNRYVKLKRKVDLDRIRIKKVLERSWN